MRTKVRFTTLLSALALAGVAGAAGASSTFSDSEGAPALDAARPESGAVKAGESHEADTQKLIYVDENGEKKVVEGTGTVVKRGYLGVELTELTPELRAHFGAPKDAGVMVARVVAGSPADKAGLKVGDIITSLDGKAVESSWDVRARVRALGEGAALPLEVQRDGHVEALSATVVQRERREMDLAPFLMKNGDGDRLMFPFPSGVAPGTAGPPAGPGAGGEMRLHPSFHSPREEMLERKLKALEKRLNELENRLPKPQN
jgi:membrane-associated protease RseP (regulator of RpoE activity)